MNGATLLLGLTAKGKHAYLYQVNNTGDKEDNDVLMKFFVAKRRNTEPHWVALE